MNAKDQAIESANAQDGFPAVPRRRPLFDVIADTLALLAEIDLAEGEVNDQQAARLDALASDLDERAESYAAVHRTLESEAEACERLAQPYLDRAKRKRAQASALKARLKDAMEATGRTKIVTPTATVAIQKNSPSLELLVPEHEAEQHIPAEYLETRVTIRKDVLKGRLLAGETFPFAQLKAGTHLRIR
jgi:hypothetical protein